ncbi:hypothetical protein PVK06_019537 [Gossypium arboreum]|uniref:Uncharacterized protein n=1 Tax=Gossypium arboreum TaxID=29729 RepID=A0ABR0PJZ2_GOSAR|nr:hypothetical protein PVK06_019537 [Gossypium arboreum]
MEEEGGTGNRQKGSRTTSTESSHIERGRSRVKHEKTRAQEIASTYYKPDGEGVKVKQLWVICQKTEAKSKTMRCLEVWGGSSQEMPKPKSRGEEIVMDLVLRL